MRRISVVAKEPFVLNFHIVILSTHRPMAACLRMDLTKIGAILRESLITIPRNKPKIDVIAKENFDHPTRW